MKLLEKKFLLQEDEIKMLKLEINNIKNKLNDNINTRKDLDGLSVDYK
jgi:hypothetical protein